MVGAHGCLSQLPLLVLHLANQRNWHTSLPGMLVSMILERADIQLVAIVMSNVRSILLAVAALMTGLQRAMPKLAVKEEAALKASASTITRCCAYVPMSSNLSVLLSCKSAHEPAAA